MRKNRFAGGGRVYALVGFCFTMKNFNPKTVGMQPDSGGNGRQLCHLTYEVRSSTLG